MAQSLAQIYVHIIFSTKHREPTIGTEVEEELHRYLGGILKQLDCTPLEVGGYNDHIHLLCCLSKKITVAKLLEEVKKSSSKWIKTKGERYHGFYWQDGYAVFSINPTQVTAVRDYIKNQHEHHSKTTFQDECRTFFRKYETAFDERYIWD